MFHGSCSHSHISYKSCGGPSLLVQCTQYKFGPGVIQTIEKAHRRTLLEGLSLYVYLEGYVYLEMKSTHLRD